MKRIKWPSLRLYGLTLMGAVFVCAAYQVIQEVIHLHTPHILPLADSAYEIIHGLIGAAFGIIVSYPLAVLIAQWQNRINTEQK